MAIKFAEVDGIGTIRLQKRRGTRNLRISISPEGEVRVGLPAWVSYQTGVEFAASRKDWINKHLPKSTPKPLQAGDRIGKAHRINIIPTGEVSGQPRVTLVENDIRVHLPAFTQPTSIKAQTAMKRGALKALTKESTVLLPQRLKSLAALHSFTYKSVKVRSLKSRWGSCDQNANITLNIFLMQLPWELIDYVIIHELTHTEHHNHSAAFWSRFEQALPGAKSVRKKLREFRPAVVASQLIS